MKILFPVETNSGLESRIFPDFWKAPAFFWYDTETEDYGTASNDGYEEDDYGKISAESAGDLGAEVIIAKEIGCAPVNRLRGFGVEAYFSKGETVMENIKLFQQQNLRRMFSGECDGSCKV